MKLTAATTVLVALAAAVRWCNAEENLIRRRELNTFDAVEWDAANYDNQVDVAARTSNDAFLRVEDWGQKSKGGKGGKAGKGEFSIITKLLRRRKCCQLVTCTRI